jgi:hypothetical protein
MGAQFPIVVPFERSYGFRPGRSQHDALDALAAGLHRRKVGFVLDADIRAFFDTISHDWLMRFLEHRIGDRRVLRLIGKWLKAGVLEDGTWTEGTWTEGTWTEGRWTECTVGTPQAAVISPLLANVYLHYVYDLWVQQWRKRHARGEMIVVRYADDTIVGFPFEDDARRFRDDLGKRLTAFALTLDVTPSPGLALFLGGFLGGLPGAVDEVVDEGEFADDGGGEHEGVEVGQAHAAVHAVHGEGQWQPGVDQAGEVARGVAVDL